MPAALPRREGKRGGPVGLTSAKLYTFRIGGCVWRIADLMTAAVAPATGAGVVTGNRKRHGRDSLSRP